MSATAPEAREADRDTLAAHVARAWTDTGLTQSQFGLELMRLASGYAEAPELEAEAAAGAEYVAVRSRDLDAVLGYMVEELANGRYADPKLRVAVDRLRWALDPEP